ncbi:hypothetical protein BUALT_Bualt04G0136500 [Buddleja alternifolia]|uniref:RRM domain-containing protein n=1 Tax=Buddleja alternifolia TaxID=168488 RepID=A0AAV6XWY3_9LAMI|nr:hypothetical protein BUALT_Bualt04G0136500 [Buddleja alternifolia]
MAFLNRVGNFLKQTASKHVNSELSASSPSLFQAIRSMSSSKLFVGGLAYGTDEMSLREAFSQYGEVIEARVILDRETGRSRGFGFVTYTSTDAASSAIQAYDGQDLHGRRIRVNYATEKTRGGGFGGGFGSGGGFGYGGQGGGYQGGNYGGAGGGSYGGGGYGGGDGNFSGGGGFGGNQYPSGGGGYGSGNSYSGGGGSSYGGVDGSVQGGGNYGGGGSNYSGNQSTFSSLLNNETAGTYGESQEPLVGHQEGSNAGNGDFGENSLEGSDKDGDDEPNDYANTRG